MRRKRYKWVEAKKTPKLLENDEVVYSKDEEDRAEVVDPNETSFDLYSSELETGNDIHLPCIDVDHSIQAVESSTRGHYHLYINVPMSWRQYKRMLKAMVKAGVVQPGYYRASVARKATYVRRPGSWKGGIDVKRQRELERLDQIRELAEISSQL